MAAAVGYRLADVDPWPACIEDVEAAFDLLRQRWSVPMAGWGHSAGGHLALMLATSRPLAAVVALSAPSDLTILDTHRPGVLAELFAGELGPASPVNHAAHLPPTRMVQGQRDRICPVVHAELLERAANNVVVDVVPGAGHGLRWPPRACLQARRRAKDWLFSALEA